MTWKSDWKSITILWNGNKPVNKLNGEKIK